MARIAVRLAVLSVLVAASLPAAAAQADTKTWTNGAGDGSWFTGGNWEPAGVPGAGDDAVVPATAATGPTIPAAGSASVRSLQLAKPLTLDGALTLGSGTSAIDANIAMSPGSQLINEGTLTLGDDVVVGAGGAVTNRPGATIASSDVVGPVDTSPTVFHLNNGGTVAMGAGLGVTLVDATGAGSYTVSPASVLRFGGADLTGASITGGDATSQITMSSSPLNGAPPLVPANVLDTSATVTMQAGTIHVPNRVHTLRTAGNVTTAGTGHLTVDQGGGMLEVVQGTFTLAVSTQVLRVNVLAGARLRGVGVVNETLTLKGGTLAPDGLMRVAYIVNEGGRFETKVTDDATFTWVYVPGTAAVEDLVIDVVAPAGYTPSAGTEQRILVSDNGVTGTARQPPQLPPGYVGVTQDATSLTLRTANKTWTNGTGDGLWETPGNWSPVGEPMAADLVHVPAGFTDVTGPHTTSSTEVGLLRLSSPLAVAAATTFTLQAGRLEAPVATGAGADLAVAGSVVITGDFDETGGGVVRVDANGRLYSSDEVSNPNLGGNTTLGPLVNGGSVDARVIEIAGGASGAGDYRVRSGTNWTVNGDSVLPPGSTVTGNGGWNVTGTLDVAGGVFDGPRLNIGATIAGTPTPGTATIAGAQSVLSLNAGHGSVATVTGTVASRADSRADSGGELRLDGGTIDPGSAAVLASTGGRITGDGTIDGPVILQTGAIVDPDGTLNVGAADFRAGSTLHVDASSASTFDKLAAAGAVTLAADVTLDAARTGGYTPSPGTTQRFLDAAGGRTGTFSTVTGIAPFELRYDGTGAELFTAPSADLELTGDPIVGIPAGEQVPYRVGILNEAGNAPDSIQVRVTPPPGVTIESGSLDFGTWDQATRTATVPAGLGPGLAANLTLNLSRTAGTDVQMETEIIASSLPDPDSTPGNAATTNPPEDDELITTVHVPVDRYAVPDGTTVDTDCATPADLCGLRHAVDTVGLSGDTVRVAPGNYPLTEQLELKPSMSLVGTDPADKPRITADLGGQVLYLGARGGVRRLADLEVVNAAAPVIHDAAQQPGRTTIERLIVRGGTGGSPIRDWAVDLENPAVVRDTIITSAQRGGLNFAGRGSAVNVTAIANGRALHFENAGESSVVRNVIARSATNTDIVASSGALHPVSSNFATGPDAGTNGNQTAAPVFVNAAAGDYRQAATSPTIDAGTTADGVTSTSDVFGAPAPDGAARDIGADEFAPSPTLEPTTHDFGDVVTGQDSADRTFTVTNPGAAPVTVTGASVAGAGFRLRGGSCDTETVTLQKNESCTIDVDFAPASAGDATGKVSAAGLEASLKGRGITPGSLALQGDLAFGVTRATLPADRPVTVTNTGQGPVTVGSIGIDAPFRIVSEDCPDSLAGSGQCTVTVGVQSGAASNQAHTGTLSVGSSTLGATWTRLPNPIAPPAITGPQGPTKDNDPDWDVTGVETGATLTCAFPGEVFSECPAGFAYTDVPDGAYTFQVRMTGLDGQTATATRAITIDTVVAPPEVAGPDDPTLQRAATFTLTGEDEATFRCTLDDREPAGCESGVQYTDLALGPHTLKVTQTDAAGNTSEPATFQWRIIGPPVNTKPPAVTGSTTRPGGKLTATDGTYSGTTPIEVSRRWERCVDGTCTAIAGSTGSTYTLVAADVGATVRVVESASNEATETPVLTPSAPFGPVTAGIAAPTVDIRELFNTRTVTFTIQGEDGASFECKLDDGQYGACATGDGPRRLSTASGRLNDVPEGPHTLRVRQTGADGAVSEPASRTFTVDTTPPAAAPTITSGPPAETTSGTVTITLAPPEPGAHHECSLDGGAFAPCTSPVTISGLQPGPHSLAVRQVDAAGNAGPVTRLAWQVLGVTVTGPPACASKRNFPVRVIGMKAVWRVKINRKGARILSATVKGADGKVLRRVRFTKQRIQVDLRNLPKGAFSLEVVLREKSGRRGTFVRTYQTCVARRP